MTSIIGMALGIIGGGIFYKFISNIFWRINFRFERNIILSILIYTSGFYLTIKILSPIIIIIGGMTSIITQLSKFAIQGCVFLFLLYIVHLVVKKH